MAATKTVPQPPPFRNTPSRSQRSRSAVLTNDVPLIPRHGVITLYGYGISVRVDQGHLVLQDGVGSCRRSGRFARVNHGLRRLVCIGDDGALSLQALRWIADQQVSFVMLERNGSILTTTGPVSPSDARVRRAQALVNDSEGAVSIARYLIDSKLQSQETVVREALSRPDAADGVAKHRASLEAATSVGEIRFIESQAAAKYWGGWRDLPVQFPSRELTRVPDHWRTFGSRNSPVSAAPRKACNPANAMLNFLYTMLESETRLTAVALGLDPGFGLIHVDSPTRDSLACDLMEPLRPKVDAMLFDWLSKGPLRRDWFFEERDGTCRLMPEIIARLAETAGIWEREAAPIAEWYARAVCEVDGRGLVGPRSRLTRSRWKEKRGKPEAIAEMPEAPRQSVCAKCGSVISKRNRHCRKCAVGVSTDALVEGAKVGRVAARSSEAIARRTASSRRQNEALQAWNPADHPEWLTSDHYTREIQPRLKALTRPAIAAATGVSVVYAGEWRNGTCVPHKRHWIALAMLTDTTLGAPLIQ